MPEVKIRQSFGGATMAHISPPVGPAAPKSMNVHPTFEETLKLHFGLGQLLAMLNTCNRSTKAGRRAAANICIYPHKNRITLNEGKLRRPDAGGEDAIVPEEPAEAE